MKDTTIDAQLEAYRQELARLQAEREEAILNGPQPTPSDSRPTPRGPSSSATSAPVTEVASAARLRRRCPCGRSLLIPIQLYLLELSSTRARCPLPRVSQYVRSPTRNVLTPTASRCRPLASHQVKLRTYSERGAPANCRRHWHSRSLEPLVARWHLFKGQSYVRAVAHRSLRVPTRTVRGIGGTRARRIECQDWCRDDLRCSRVSFTRRRHRVIQVIQHVRTGLLLTLYECECTSINYTVNEASNPYGTVHIYGSCVYTGAGPPPRPRGFAIIRYRRPKQPHGEVAGDAEQLIFHGAARPVVPDGLGGRARQRRLRCGGSTT